MLRRDFLSQLALAAGSAACSPGLAAPLEQRSTRNVDLRVDTDARLGQIPADFIGLGYEISSVASGPLSAKNTSYVSLVRLLGPSGVIRIGGNTSDYSTYSAAARPAAFSKATVINDACLHDLAMFLDATGWSLIWGVNLGRGSVEDAVREARAVARAVGRRLLAIEIGNEPDLYVHEGHRTTYSYENYSADYLRYKAAIRSALPQVGFAGPDVAGATEWVEQFAKAQHADLKLLTHHYYREGQNPTSTADKLLHPDPKLDAMLSRMRKASDASGIPYRICETNSFSGGGRPGVSDSYAASLWTLDYLCVLAWHGAAGVNMETGLNQLDFISSYSPIMPAASMRSDDPRGRYRAAASWYGMLAFTQGCRGERLAVRSDPGALNLTAYATAENPTRLRLIVINKETATDADVTIMMEPGQTAAFRKARLMRLSAPSLESRTEITLGDAAVSATGVWHGVYEPTRASAMTRIRVSAASAAILEFSV